MSDDSGQQPSTVQELQIKVAFLEDAMSKLSDEYFSQQKELQKLSLLVEALVEKLATTQEGDPSGTDVVVDERPPHY